MYDLDKACEFYKKHLENNPNYDHELVMGWKEKMPQEFAQKMYEDEYGCHIFDETMYNEAVHLLVWANDKDKGEKWTISDIVKLSGMDFADKAYTKYDYAYMVNVLYSDYCHIFTEPTYYLKMAKAYLEDPDYMGDPSERAYKNAIKRIKYFKNK